MLGGKKLIEPLAKLCDSDIKPYSLLLYETVTLLGGSDRKI